MKIQTPRSQDRNTFKKSKLSAINELLASHDCQKKQIDINVNRYPLTYFAKSVVKTESEYTSTFG